MDHVNGYIVDAANQAGVDAGVLAMIANFESGFNSDTRPIARDSSRNTVRQFDGTMAMSTAFGLGQFIDDTWAGMLSEYGTKYGVANASDAKVANSAANRSDPKLQAQMLAEFTRENIVLGRNLGGVDDSANVYALHNLGSTGGQAFLAALAKNPDTLVSEVLGKAVIRNNSSLYGDGSITLGSAYARMAQAMNLGQAYADEARVIQYPDH